MCVYIYIYFHILAYIFDIVRLGSNNVTCVLIPSYSFWKFNLVNNNNNITIYRLRYNFKSLFQILRFISWLSSLVDISDIFSIVNSSITSVTYCAWKKSINSLDYFYRLSPVIQEPPPTFVVTKTMIFIYFSKNVAIHRQIMPDLCFRSTLKE